MENPYWRKQYEDAPSGACKEYYRVVFETSGFVSGTERTDKEAERLLSDVRLDRRDVEYIQSYAGSGQARAYYRRIINRLGGDENGTVPAAALLIELRNPYHREFPELEAKSSFLEIGIPIRPAEFEEIREKLLRFDDDPDDFLTVGLTDASDALYIQAKRTGDLCRVEVGYDVKLPGECHPFLIGTELPFDRAVDLFRRFCVLAEHAGYEDLMNKGFRIVRYGKGGGEEPKPPQAPIPAAVVLNSCIINGGLSVTWP
jgi:hypothetical protein